MVPRWSIFLLLVLSEVISLPLFTSQVNGTCEKVWSGLGCANLWQKHLQSLPGTPLALRSCFFDWGSTLFCCVFFFSTCGTLFRPLHSSEDWVRHLFINLFVSIYSVRCIVCLHWPSHLYRDGSGWIEMPLHLKIHDLYFPTKYCFSIIT